MANETVATLKIGAAIASSVTSVFGGIKKQVDGITTAAEALQTKQKDLQRTITQGLEIEAGSTLLRMKARYDPSVAQWRHWRPSRRDSTL